MKKPKKKPQEAMMPVSAPADWHRQIAGIVGEISYAVIKHKLSRTDLTRWATTLKTISGEMENVAAGRPR